VGPAPAEIDFSAFLPEKLTFILVVTVTVLIQFMRITTDHIVTQLKQ